jgi:dTDP-4-amino-4,6-dideoxygalactose transaminase
MEFERKFAEWQGSKYAISASSGTSALHIALAALGIGPGDEVIVPSYTFIASSFSIVQAGAIPRFADRSGGGYPAVCRRQYRRPLHQRRVGRQARQ